MTGRVDRNGRMAGGITAVVVLMGALGWASVPLYDLFCRVTGYGGTTRVSSDTSAITPSGPIVRIRFDASRARDMPWEFRPVQKYIDVRMGQTALAFYEAHNPTNMPVAGTASFNVAPFAAGSHFTKIDCFCFQEQVLMPGETVQMPVTFYVDPDMMADDEATGIREITLSYTFHVIDMPQDHARLEQGTTPRAPVN